ncbi:MAG: hypothetical protein LBU27_05140 [Candidatus Peribacteria bacterium]|jgi:hypothetical protein|nr:hypothetical protein [Candidatus Peribacteria bacterium]
MKKVLLFLVLFLCGYGISLAETPLLGASFAENTRIHNVHYGNTTIPSPVFVLTGVVPNHADTIHLHRKNGKKAENFTIAIQDWKEFSLTFSLQYGNLGSGLNRYTISFFSGDKLVERGTLLLSSSFEKRNIDTDMYLYINPQTEPEKKNGDIGFLGGSYLLSQGEKFSLLTTPFIYNIEKQQLFTTDNLKTSKQRMQKGDLYLNGELIAENVPVAYGDTGGGNAISFSYEPQRNYLEIIYGDADGCGYNKHIEGYALSTKEKYLDVAIFNHCVSDKEDWYEEMGANGVRLEYLNKKLEVYPLFTTGGNETRVALKYRYSLRNGTGRDLRMEDFIFQNQEVKIDEAGICEDSFSYTFDTEKGTLIIQRKENVGGKSETYTWKIAQIPNYYRTRP